MDKITSFKVNHDHINPGIYISRVDSDITTYDLRTKKPNAGDYMDNLTMHSAEHMLATFLRNSEIRDSVIYFGPMGCQTGFYLLVRNADNEKVLNVLKKCLKDTVSYNGEIFGSKKEECGNYKNLSLAAAKKICSDYLDLLNSRDWSFDYDRF